MGRVRLITATTRVEPDRTHVQVCADLIIRFPLLAGLCPDWADWDPNEPVQNAREAMQQADDWLGVPQVRRMISASHDAHSYCTLER